MKDSLKKSTFAGATSGSMLTTMGAGKRRSDLFALTIILAIMVQPVYSTDPAEAEILALIAAVEDSGCVFIRNDTRHDAKAAAEHLRLKYRRGRRYADTAEHFIDRLASKSSWSGKSYVIECADVRNDAGVWLTGELARLRSP